MIGPIRSLTIVVALVAAMADSVLAVRLAIKGGRVVASQSSARQLQLQPGVSHQDTDAETATVSKAETEIVADSMSAADKDEAARMFAQLKEDAREASKDKDYDYIAGGYKDMDEKGLYIETADGKIMF